MGHIFSAAKRDRLHSPERHESLPPGRVLEKLALQPGETLLDIGAGTGFFAIPAAALVEPGGRVIAADISDEMLATLQERFKGLPGTIECQLADMDRVPLADGVADAVLLAFVFHEMPDQSRWLEEIHRLLKPGGRAAFVEWDTVLSPPGPPREERLGYEEIVHLAEAAGFSVEKKELLNSTQYMCLLRK